MTRATSNNDALSPMWFVPKTVLVCSVFGGIIQAQSIPSVATHLSVTWPVSLSVVCHTRAPCLNRLADLNFKCYLADTLVRTNATLCYMGVLTPREV